MGVIAACADRSQNVCPEEGDGAGRPLSDKNNDSNEMKWQCPGAVVVTAMPSEKAMEYRREWGVSGRWEGTEALYGQGRTEECGDLALALSSSWAGTEWGD